MALVKERGYLSIAFPLIGAGTGGSKEEKVASIMQNELENTDYDGVVAIVKYRENAS